MECRTIVFRNGSASVRLHVWTDKEATLGSLYSRKKRCGDATRLLREVIEYVDREGLRVILLVEQYGRHPSSDNSWLIKFYRKFGFRLVDKELLWMRRPRRKNTV